MNAIPRTALAALALGAALAGGCVQAPPAPSSQAGSPDRVMNVERFDGRLLARAIFKETNRVRLSYGLSPLKGLPALDAAADEQAAYTALTLRAEHENPVPDERDVAERVQHQGLAGSRFAENAIMMPAGREPGSPEPAFTYGTYAAFLVEKWMNSPGHRANLLNPEFTYLGCAARPGRGIVHGEWRVFATQVFFLPEKPVFP